MNKMTQREVDETAARWSYSELWDKFPIPSRPDTEELMIEEKSIRDSAKNPEEINLMILGSTIEYRSLCKRLGIAPYVVDFAKTNFDSLTAYSKEKFEKEQFIESDWLEIQQKDFFDFILGHRPFNVIRKDQVFTLFKRMYDSLKPNGVFFCRGNVQFPGDKDALETLVEKWAFAPNRPYRLFSYLEVALYIHCTDQEGYLDYPKARETIRNYYENGKISEDDYNDIRPLISLPPGTKFRSFVPKEELEKHMRDAGFEKIEWLFTSHEFTKNMPIIKLTK